MPSPLPGFHPSKVLPCVIDVGTNNAALRADPLYCGLDQPRITGPAYYELVDEVRGIAASDGQRIVLIRDP